VTTSRRSADRALLRDRPVLVVPVKTRPPKRSPLNKESDIQITFNWNKFNLDAPPDACGIYAITSIRQKTWYYIGRSQNIAKRIAAANHPVQVTKDTALDLHYWYLRVNQKHVNWAERYLIKEHDPEWNGATSFDASWHTQWVCCDVRLPLTSAEKERQYLWLKDIWGDDQN
jgi:hypothetical protein